MKKVNYTWRHANVDDQLTIIDFKRNSIIEQEGGISKRERNRIENFFVSSVKETLNDTYIIEVDGEPVGFMLSYNDGPDYYVEEMYLEKGFRGMDIGTHILKELITQNKNVSLWVDKKHKRLYRLYRVLGFKVNFDDGSRYYMVHKESRFFTFSFSIVFVVSFLLCWFKEEVYIYIWIFWLLLVILCAVFFAVSIWVISKRQNKDGYVALAILVANILVVFFFPFRIIRTNFEFKLYARERARVIELVEGGELIPNKIGTVSLPDEYKKASSSGEAHVYKCDEEGQVIGFWIERGLLSQSIELIYSTGGEELIRKNAVSHPIASIMEFADRWYYVVINY